MLDRSSIVNEKRPGGYLHIPQALFRQTLLSGCFPAFLIKGE